MVSQRVAFQFSKKNCMDSGPNAHGSGEAPFQFNHLSHGHAESVDSTGMFSDNKKICYPGCPAFQAQFDQQDDPQHYNGNNILAIITARRCLEQGSVLNKGPSRLDKSDDVSARTLIAQM